MIRSIFLTLLTIFALAFGTVQVSAQSTEVALSQKSDNADAPLEIDSDSLNIDQETGIAVFDGSVVAIQGTLRLAADKVEAFFSEATDDQPRQIEKLVATGNVILVSGEDAASADVATYVLTSQVIVMEGNAILTQGVSAISGALMTISMKDGSAVFTGRVKTVLNAGGSQ